MDGAHASNVGARRGSRCRQGVGFGAARAGDRTPAARAGPAGVGAAGLWSDSRVARERGRRHGGDRRSDGGGDERAARSAHDRSHLLQHDEHVREARGLSARVGMERGRAPLVRAASASRLSGHLPGASGRAAAAARVVERSGDRSAAGVDRAAGFPERCDRGSVLRARADPSAHGRLRGGGPAVPPGARAGPRSAAGFGAVASGAGSHGECAGAARAGAVRSAAGSVRPGEAPAGQGAGRVRGWRHGGGAGPRRTSWRRSPRPTGRRRWRRTRRWRAGWSS